MVLGIFENGSPLRDHYVFTWKSIEILNVFHGALLPNLEGEPRDFGINFYKGELIKIQIKRKLKMWGESFMT